MKLPGFLIWIALYVSAFIIFAIAVFISVKGVMIWVCLLLAGIMLGISFVTIRNQVKMQTALEEMQRQVVEGLGRDSAVKEEPKKTR